jgi:hypothetical protein
MYRRMEPRVQFGFPEIPTVVVVIPGYPTLTRQSLQRFVVHSQQGGSFSAVQQWFKAGFSFRSSA